MPMLTEAQLRELESWGPSAKTKRLISDILIYREMLRTVADPSKSNWFRCVYCEGSVATGHTADCLITRIREALGEGERDG